MHMGGVADANIAVNLMELRFTADLMKTWLTSIYAHELDVIKKKITFWWMSSSSFTSYVAHSSHKEVCLTVTRTTLSICMKNYLPTRGIVPN